MQQWLLYYRFWDNQWCGINIRKSQLFCFFFQNWLQSFCICCRVENFSSIWNLTINNFCQIWERPMRKTPDQREQQKTTKRDFSHKQFQRKLQKKGSKITFHKSVLSSFLNESHNIVSSDEICLIKVFWVKYFVPQYDLYSVLSPPPTLVSLYFYPPPPPHEHVLFSYIATCYITKYIL